MMMLLRLAWRNLERSRRRAALMVAVVALGSWAIVVLWGVTDGFYDSMIRAQISLDTAELQVHPAGYLDDPELKKAFSPARLETLQAELKDLAQVRSVSPRLVAEGLLQSAYGSAGVEVRGFDPLLEGRTTKLTESLVAGRFLAQSGEMIMGRPLAEVLDVRLGERVVLQVQGLTRPHSRGLRLVGLLSTGLPLLDKFTVFVHLQDARALTEAYGASELALALRRGADPAALRAKLSARLGPSVQVSTFMDLNPLMGNLIKVGHFEMLPTMLLLALLAGFGVANTITFTVLERTRQFGVMLALGLRPRQLSRLVTLEASLTSGLGFLIGGGLGYGANAYLARVGFNIGLYSDAFPDLGLPHLVYAQLSGRHWLYALAAVVLTALIAARYPARRAAHLEPTEAMRYV